MERKLKSFWVLSLSLLAATSQVQARNGSVWDDIIKRTFKKAKIIRLTAGRDQKPLKFSPKVIGFKGVIQIPSQLYLINGSGSVHNAAGQIVIDGQIVCNYSPKSNHGLHNKIYYLNECSDRSDERDQINVSSKVELRLNYASSDRASLLANVRVVRSDEVDYGLVFPYLNASEGQILMYNGEAWVAADPSELNLQGLQGEKGEQGEPGAPGPQGPQGPAGADGAPGVAGPKGDKGDKGDAGAPGVAGAQGPQGPAGPAGATGAVGPAGAAGAVGPMGPQGPKGDAGAPGVAGAAGAVGPMGPKGDAGVAGAAGPQGPAGATGPMGPQGPKGDKGDAGVAGAAGPQGPAGATGPMGPQGPAGLAGADGAPGVAGPVGPMGPQGPKGDRGADGAQGAAGPQGPAGAQGPMGMMGPMGPQGPAGAQGLPGEAGAQGAQGPAGAKGDKGDKGDRGLSEIAYMRDQRPSGTLGGTCTSGQWNTRVLNTLGGDSNFISLANNRFTLQPGVYFIEAVAPGHGINQHQAKLKVIETNSDVMYGTNIASASNAPSTTLSVIMGEIVVTEASTFEIQHRCAFTRVDSGFGVSANFGSPEIYTQVKIIKKQ